MSRTDAHLSLHVRLVVSDVGYVEVHDHSTGVCQLAGDSAAVQLRMGECGRRFHWEVGEDALVTQAGRGRRTHESGSAQRRGTAAERG